MKVRCTVCHTYHPAEDAYRTMGLGSVCSRACFERLRGRKAAQPSRGQLLARTEAVVSPKKRERLDGVTAATRRLVMKRDNGRCRRCGIEASHLHHIKYRSVGGGHDERNLIVLCVGCHALVHSSKKHWMPILLKVIEELYAGRSVTVGQVERWDRL